MQDPKKTTGKLRKQHNSELIRRMRNGEPLNAVDSKASWFPPRPIIQKDPREIARVYNTPGLPEVSVAKETREQGLASGKIVQLKPAWSGTGPLGEAS